MSDRIFIDKLEVACRVGETKSERAFPQVVYIDLVLYRPLNHALIRDDIRRTVDYARVIGDVRRFATSRPFALIETIADQTAALILKGHQVDSIQVRVTKKAFPGVASVAAEVWRNRTDHGQKA